MLLVGDIDLATIAELLARYALRVEYVQPGQPITGTYWGEPEAGIVGKQVFVRQDTPVHSMLHEVCHIICMTSERREHLFRDAGGDDIEESAVCYLQIVLADHLPGVGRQQISSDMDAWGYTFRLGSAARWFRDDAEDARQWLEAQGLLTGAAMPSFRLRGTK